MKRAGFSLVEVIVAMVLLTIAMLGIAGTALLAARTLGQGEVREQASQRASGILDSLMLSQTRAAGTQNFAGYRITWTADTTQVSVRTTFADGSGFDLQAVP